MTLQSHHPVASVRSGTLERRDAIYREAVALIESEFATDLTLDVVAHRLATSRRQLQRVFAERGNTSFRELLLDVRMRKAREALGQEGVRIRDVARLVGYDQASDFTKTFRRHHGMPPTAYRRSHAGRNGSA